MRKSTTIEIDWNIVQCIYDFVGTHRHSQIALFRRILILNPLVSLVAEELPILCYRGFRLQRYILCTCKKVTRFYDIRLKNNFVCVASERELCYIPFVHQNETTKRKSWISWLSSSFKGRRSVEISEIPVREPSDNKGLHEFPNDSHSAHTYSRACTRKTYFRRYLNWHQDTLHECTKSFPTP